jgi:sugar lactone lactonase YvrE
MRADKEGCMNRHPSRAGIFVLALLAGLAAVFAVAAAPARSDAPPSGLSASAVSSWPWADPYGCFAEGLALGADGYLYASVTTWGEESNTGQIVRIAPIGGAKTAFGPSIETPGLLTGVAFDAQGHLFVASATFSDEDLPGVYRVDASSVKRVLTLPAGSFPNGLAFRDGYLYVSDSALGAIWRTRPDARTTLATPWLQSDLLAPGTGQDDNGIGANGIAFRPDGLYVAVADAGRIVRIATLPNGTAGRITVLSERPELRSADGIAFDGLGNLWVTANYPGSGRLLMLTTGGRVVVRADQTGWLDYPTQPVFVPSTKTLGLYVENGSFDVGTPSVIAISGPA